MQYSQKSQKSTRQITLCSWQFPKQVQQLHIFTEILRQKSEEVLNSPMNDCVETIPRTSMQLGPCTKRVGRSLQQEYDAEATYVTFVSACARHECSISVESEPRARSLLRAVTHLSPDNLWPSLAIHSHAGPRRGGISPRGCPPPARNNKRQRPKLFTNTACHKTIRVQISALFYLKYSTRMEDLCC